jgi:type I restriction enzyme S subunit
MSTAPKKTKIEEVETDTDSELPEGWTTTTLDEVGRWSTGGTPSRKDKNYFNGQIPWVKSGDLNDGLITKTDERITRAGLNNSAAKLIPPGAVTVALYGATIGKLGVLGVAAATNQACANCEVDEKITERWFLFYYLLHQRQALVEAGQGGAQPNLTNGIIRDWPIWLPPIAEQDRVIKKVRDLLNAVGATRIRLKKVPILLKSFRQAVLAAASSGKLTEDWRAKREDSGSASELLTKVFEDRLSEWARHQKRREAKRSDKYPLPTRLDSQDLPSIPDDWAWATLDQIGQEGRPVLYGIIKPGPHVADGVPYVRVTEMKDGHIDISQLRRTSKERALKFVRAKLEAGDILISKDGTIGRVAVVPPELEGGNITQHVMRAPVHDFIDRDYIVAAIRAPYSQGWLTGELKGVALQGVNVEDFRRLPLPIPPIVEQQEIVRRVAALFKLADAIEKRVAAATLRAERLTQAILAKAFRGELVPTEAELARREGREYEPASVLLERIKTERAKKKPEKVTKRKMRARGTS